MKTLKYFLFSLLTILAASCDKGLDPINPVSPKADKQDPTLVITSPVLGKPFVSSDAIATLNVKLTATDDIELQSIAFLLDGADAGSLTYFKDYRRAVVTYPIANIADGDHSLSVTVTDKTGKSVSQSVDFKKITAPPYTPADKEVLYLPFDDNFLDLTTGTEVGVVGSPGFAEGKVNGAYAGVVDSYVYTPSAGKVGDEFGLAFWYKVNPDPLRAGIFAISPQGGTGTDEERKFGIRMFRENSGDKQNVGLNMGIGTTDVWMNPIVALPAGEGWVHIALSITATHAIAYVNGAVVAETDLVSKIDWTGCSFISMGSGQPNFVVWEHFADLSLYDELHLYTRAITAEEVAALYNVKKK
jgi:hypothetical protein